MLMNTLDIENHMLSNQACDNEPERDEDLEYDIMKQEQADDLREVLRDIALPEIRRIDWTKTQAD